MINHPIRAGTRAVDLVDDNDGVETPLEGFCRDKTRLGHRAIHGIDQQQHRIHHGQHPLYLSTKISMAGRIDDVNAVVIPIYRRVLGEDGNAALALLII